MGHRIISTLDHHVKMQRQDFGDKIAADNYDFPSGARAKKRKLDEADEGPEPERRAEDPRSAYLLHRQSVFGISVGKLDHYRQLPDPSLRRSVLICNTLRTIECEMVSEGMEVDPVAASAFLPSIQTGSLTELDPPPPSDYPSLVDLDCGSAGRSTPYPEWDRGESYVQPHRPSDTERDLCQPFGQPQRPCGPDRSPFEAHEPFAQPQRPLDADGCRPGISWSSVLDFSSQSDVDGHGGNHGMSEADFWSCEGESASGGPHTSPSSSSDSGISTASDEIFGDIDLSLYDFDLLPLSPPSAARLAPPSAEELLRAFSNRP